MLAFYGANGLQLRLTNDAAYDLVIAVATGELAEISDIAQRLEQATEPWSRDG